MGRVGLPVSCVLSLLCRLKMVRKHVVKSNCWVSGAIWRTLQAWEQLMIITNWEKAVVWALILGQRKWAAPNVACRACTFGFACTSQCVCMRVCVCACACACVCVHACVVLSCSVPGSLHTNTYVHMFVCARAAGKPRYLAFRDTQNLYSLVVRMRNVLAHFLDKPDRDEEVAKPGITTAIQRMQVGRGCGPTGREGT